MELPARLGKYELVELLGGGGMSHVYRAIDTTLDRTVAIKLLTAEGKRDEEMKLRFFLEARYAGKINHENVVQVHDFDEVDGHQFLVMQFLEGESLRSMIRANRPRTTEWVLKLALQLASALECIHEQGFIHRDLKPDNVHVNKRGVAKLMDFGIAKTTGLNLTSTGFALGTSYYMAPEQVTGAEITPFVDIYAFGILLSEVLTGKKPITSDSIQGLFFQILNEPFDVTGLREIGVQEEIVDLVRDCTQKKPEDRPKSASVLRQRVQSILLKNDVPRAAEPISAEPKRRPRVGRNAVAVAVAALLALLTIYVGLVRGRSIEQSAKIPTLPLRVKTASGEMALVPGGPFLTGKERTSVDVAPFYMDVTEVSNASFDAYLKSSNEAPPEGFPVGGPNDPATNMSFLQAKRFATWAGQRLPRALEWEKAARGTDGRNYPWGNEDNPSHANVSGNPRYSGHPAPVDSFPQGASQYGLLHLIGNVSEFVEQPVKPAPDIVKAYQLVVHHDIGAEESWFQIRGGSYEHGLASSRADESVPVPESYRAKDLGFRCVREVPSTKPGLR